MNPHVFEYVLYQLFNTPIKAYPFEHLYVEDVFPKEYYQRLLAHLPATEQYTPIEKLGKVGKGKYLERLVFPLLPANVETLEDPKKEFWQHFMQRFLNDEFKAVVSALFIDVVEKRFASAAIKPELEWTVDLVRDTTNYSIGPHTDSPYKVITLLFYLPTNASLLNIGTSLFAPKRRGYTDPAGIHRPFTDFNLITTMPFKPNSMFGFARTDASWHGVVPITETIERNSISFQLMIKRK